MPPNGMNCWMPDPPCSRPSRQVKSGMTSRVGGIVSEQVRTPAWQRGLFGFCDTQGSNHVSAEVLVEIGVGVEHGLAGEVFENVLLGGTA